jgi:hypothetical protein
VKTARGKKSPISAEPTAEVNSPPYSQASHPALLKAQTRSPATTYLSLRLGGIFFASEEGRSLCIALRRPRAMEGSGRAFVES